jgi:hypothetical protein
MKETQTSLRHGWDQLSFYIIGRFKRVKPRLLQINEFDFVEITRGYIPTTDIYLKLDVERG